MLSASILNRVSAAYRVGYQDGHTLAPRNVMGERGSFAHHDYTKGYEAGLNDRYWSDHLAGSESRLRDDFMRAYA